MTIKKMFGLAVVPISALFILSCSETIPGHPEKIMREYIEAVKKDDFATIYSLNMKTARQKKYLGKTSVGNVEMILRENFEKNRDDYESVPISFNMGEQWVEKYFFAKSESYTIGEPYSPKPVGDDPVNAKYESSVSCYVPVLVKYGDSKTSLEYNGKKMKSAKYDCTLRKIREGNNARVYSHDDDWYLAGCVIDTSTIELY